MHNILCVLKKTTTSQQERNFDYPQCMDSLCEFGTYIYVCNGYQQMTLVDK